MSNHVYSPRIVGEPRPDCHSLETLLASPPFAGRQGESLALALYDYLTSPVDGVWHGWPPNENAGEPVGWGDVSDPVKTLNAYGWAICGQNAELLFGLYHAAGLPARIRCLSGHKVCGVFHRICGSRDAPVPSIVQWRYVCTSRCTSTVRSRCIPSSYTRISCGKLLRKQ